MAAFSNLLIIMETETPTRLPLLPQNENLNTRWIKDQSLIVLPFPSQTPRCERSVLSKRRAEDVMSGAWAASLGLHAPDPEDLVKASD